MALDKSVLDTPVFSAFAQASGKRYMFICNMKTNVSRWSENAVEYFDLPDEYMYDAGSIWIEHVHPDDRKTYQESLDDIFSGRALVRDFDYRAKNKSGEYVVCTCHGMVWKGKDGEPDLFAGFIENHGIMDNIDPNTGLYNIYEFWKQIHVHCEKKEDISVLEIGINNFSDINDMYDYETGNEVLRKVAAIFLDIMGDKGNIFRMDGVRFAFYFAQKDKSWISRFYRRLQEELRKKFIANDNLITVSISGGVVICNGEVDEHSVLAGLSYALAQSKYRHHGELVFFDNESSDSNTRNLALIEALRHSVRNKCKGFYLCYQPLISADREKLIGMEALLRWKDEKFGDVQPSIFIPWLESDTCFFELGNWILEEALKAAKKIVVEYPDFVVNVNVAYTQLERVGFVKAVENILRKMKFPPENLCLELTERCRILDREYLKEEVYKLKALGVQVAIDDFGMGFSSLNLLKDLPVDVLKIDREFITEIEKKIENQAIVESVTKCANKLGIRVCMEGVEDKQMIDFIKDYNAYSYQGYYYSKPITIDEFYEKYL